MDRRAREIARLMIDFVNNPSPTLAAVDDDGNRMRQPSLEEIAKRVNLSPSQLYVVLRENNIAPPRRLVRQLQMARAKEMAETTFLNIDQILYEIGVGDHRAFRRSFKETYGCTLIDCRRTANQQTAGFTGKLAAIIQKRGH